MNKYTIKYEFLNTLYNGYSIFFGTIFPILLIHLISRSVLKNVPENMKSEVITTIFMGMAMLIPLASIFLSHASTYSNELDKHVTERILLFGFSEKDIFLNKLISYSIFLTLCLGIYLLGTIPFFNLKIPTLKAGIIWILGIYVLSGIMMALAHGLATMIRKFGLTYGVSMGIYFAMMILSGNMGVSVSDLPKSLRWLSDLLPMRQLGSGYIDFWMGRDFNFGPLIQSMIFMTAVSTVILLIAFKVRDRKN